ncbi:MAG: helix-turn-helix domain-containing protein [Clostridia bacterium]
MFEPLKKQLAEVAITDYCLMDHAGMVMMSDQASLEDTEYPGYDRLMLMNGDFSDEEGTSAMRIRVGRAQYYFTIMNEKALTRKALDLLNMSIRNYIRSHMEKYDKAHFMKEIIGGRLAAGEIMKKASALRIKNEMKRVAIVVRYRTKPDYPVEEIVSNIFQDKKDGIVIEMENGDTIYIANADEDEALSYAKTIIDTLEEELYTPFYAGVGSMCGQLQEIRKSYDNACTAIDSGMGFNQETSIFSYQSLGIGKLLYKLDAATLETYLKETIDISQLDKIDDEIIKTLQKFFENNLNISETARQLYLHRNTLVYRIDKVLKNTGLDVRNFDDAVLFKVIYMIKCYIEKKKET